MGPLSFWFFLNPHLYPKQFMFSMQKLQGLLCPYLSRKKWCKKRKTAWCKKIHQCHQNKKNSLLFGCSRKREVLIHFLCGTLFFTRSFRIYQWCRLRLINQTRFPSHPEIKNKMLCSDQLNTTSKIKHWAVKGHCMDTTFKLDTSRLKLGFWLNVSRFWPIQKWSKNFQIWS